MRELKMWVRLNSKMLTYSYILNGRPNSIFYNFRFKIQKEGTNKCYELFVSDTKVMSCELFERDLDNIGSIRYALDTMVNSKIYITIYSDGRLYKTVLQYHKIQIELLSKEKPVFVYAGNGEE